MLLLLLNMVVLALLGASKLLFELILELGERDFTVLGRQVIAAVLRVAAAFIVVLFNKIIGLGLVLVCLAAVLEVIFLWVGKVAWLELCPSFVQSEGMAEHLDGEIRIWELG